MFRTAATPLHAAFFGLLFCFGASGGLILNLPAGVNPDSLTVSMVATGLSYPYSMQILADQSLLVGISTPHSGTDYLSATGGLMRLTNAQGTGVTVYDGLPYPVESVRSITSSLIAVAQAGAGAEEINVRIAAGAKVKPGKLMFDKKLKMAKLSKKPAVKSSPKTATAVP